MIKEILKYLDYPQYSALIITDFPDPYWVALVSQHKNFSYCHARNQFQYGSGATVTVSPPCKDIWVRYPGCCFHQIMVQTHKPVPDVLELMARIRGQCPNPIPLQMWINGRPQISVTPTTV